MKLRHHMQLVLQPKVRAKGNQKPLKDLVAVHKKQDLSLGAVSIFLIN